LSILNKKRFILTAKLGITGIVVMMLLVTSKSALPLANAAAAGSHNKRSGIGSFLPIPKGLITSPNQNFPLPSNAVSGSDIPKNMIVGPSCVSGCATIIGTTKDDIIYGVLTTDVIIYGLNGDDVITGGPGNSKLYGGDGNDEINGGSGNALMVGGNGDDVLIGGSGNNILVGGPGNDQLYSGTGTDTLIGGTGADFFNCGSQTSSGGSPSSAVVLDFNPGEGDTKSNNCKYVFTVGGAPAVP